MTQLESKDSSKNLYTQTKPNSSNITVITDMLDKRINRSVYVSQKIINEFSFYAKGTHEGVAHHLECALLEYMIKHPRDNHTTVVQQELLEKIENGIQRELEEKILCRNIKDCLETLDEIESTDRGNFSIVFSELVKYVSDAIKFRAPSDRLLSLLHKVKESGRLE